MEQIEEKMELPNENVKKKLDEVIRRKGLVKYEIELSAGSKKGDNYSSTTYKIQVSGSKENGEKTNLNLFCKIPVDRFRLEDNSNESFQREIKIYEEVIKKMKLLESDKDIKDGFTSYAECYMTGSDILEEFLILEDLSHNGFALFDRVKPLDFNHSELVVKALGKFHAYSFSLREQNPEVLKRYSEELTENFIKENMERFVQLFTDRFLKSAVEKLRFEGVYQEKWEQFYTNYHRIMKDCVKGSLAEPYAVVCHGDSHINNIMFKYENGVPIEVCFVDWQVTRYSSPVLDLVYYIFSNTQKPFRDQHYKTILDIYYETFCSFLKQLGGDPNKMFPYSEFQNQLRRFGKFGLGMAVMLVPALTYNRDNAVTKEKVGTFFHITNNEKALDIWTSSLSDVVKDMVDLGYL